MGEAKNRAGTKRQSIEDIPADVLQGVHQLLLDDGKFCEAGWVGFRLAAYPQGAPTAQLEALRETFFAGCQHTFHGIMTAMEPDAEPTDNDLRRMDNIDKELRVFLMEFQEKYGLISKRGKA